MSNNPPAAATLITVAPTGAESEKSAVPALPVTLDELVTTAKTMSDSSLIRASPSVKSLA